MVDLNELLKHTARSLYLSARLLPAAVRDAFCISYLLCRYADTIADTSLLPPQERIGWIKRFPSFLVQPDEAQLKQLVTQIVPAAGSAAEEKLLHHFSACREAFLQLSRPQQEATLQVVHAVCHGMEIDLQTFPPETAGRVEPFATDEDLENYCHLMGGAPGVFWSQLIAMSVALPVAEKDFLTWGKDIGDALQIVNILRDLPRDLRIGRCYFPDTDLRAQGLSAADLLHPENAARFEPIKQKWIAWGRGKLCTAHPYLAALPKTQLRHRAAVAWPVLWAADTLAKLEQTPNLLDPNVRVKIPRSRIYATMAATPAVLAANFVFDKWLNAKLSVGK